MRCVGDDYWSVVLMHRTMVLMHRDLVLMSVGTVDNDINFFTPFTWNVNIEIQHEFLSCVITFRSIYLQVLILLQGVGLSTISVSPNSCVDWFARRERRQLWCASTTVRLSTISHTSTCSSRWKEWRQSRKPVNFTSTHNDTNLFVEMNGEVTELFSVGRGVFGR